MIHVVSMSYCLWISHVVGLALNYAFSRCGGPTYQPYNQLTVSVDSMRGMAGLQLLRNGQVYGVLQWVMLVFATDSGSRNVDWPRYVTNGVLRFDITC